MESGGRRLVRVGSNMVLELVLSNATNMLFVEMMVVVPLVYALYSVKKCSSHTEIKVDCNYIVMA